MDRKIIIKMEDFNKEIYFFLTEVGAGIPMDWNAEALDRVRSAAIEAYENMGVTLEIDGRSHSLFSPFPQQLQDGRISNSIVKKKGGSRFLNSQGTEGHL